MQFLPTNQPTFTIPSGGGGCIHSRLDLIGVSNKVAKGGKWIVNDKCLVLHMLGKDKRFGYSIGMCVDWKKSERETSRKNCLNGCGMSQIHESEWSPFALPHTPGEIGASLNHRFAMDRKTHAIQDRAKGLIGFEVCLMAIPFLEHLSLSPDALVWTSLKRPRPLRST